MWYLQREEKRKEQQWLAHLFLIVLKKPNWNDPPDIHKKNDDYQQDKYPSWLPHETDITKASHAFPT